MPRIASKDARAIAEIVELLDSVPERPRSALPEVLGSLGKLVGADQAVAYGIRVGEHLSTDWAHGQGLAIPIETAQREFDKTLRSLPSIIGLYSPARPEPDQRNVALLIPPIERLEVAPPPSGVQSFSKAWRAWHDQPRGAPAQVAFFRRIGASHRHCLRAVVCDGEALLGWFGVYGDRPFSARDRLVLSRLIAPLHRRLKLEDDWRWLGHGSEVIQGLLQTMPGAAFVLDRRGLIQAANALGRAQLEGPGGRALRSQLASGARAVPRATVQPLGAAFRLVTIPPARPNAGREAAARVRWGLTPRQAQVLVAMSAGKTNKAIAAELGCSHGTVELHVSAVLDKLEVENRSGAVARFWTELSD